jgi:hypothetical protein
MRTISSARRWQNAGLTTPLVSPRGYMERRSPVGYMERRRPAGALPELAPMTPTTLGFAALGLAVAAGVGVGVYRLAR